MKDDKITKLKNDLQHARVSVRVAALNRITSKRGSKIILKIEDDRVVPILIDALSDKSLRVQRAAARGLRPWVKSKPELLSTILPHYTTSTFSGDYTHVGLYDVREEKVLIPRFQATKGHASLLSDGDTDSYFKFEFYRPRQAPRRFSAIDPSRQSAHLVLHFIVDWSYSRQCLVPSIDERRQAANVREQERYATAVVDFYRQTGLPYEVAVHRLVLGGNEHPKYELAVDKIRGVNSKSRTSA